MHFFHRLVSVVFHPLMMVTYSLMLLLSANPYAFGAQSMGDTQAMVLLFGIFISTFLLPAVGVGLMVPLGFIQSIHMRTKEERVIPYILTGIFYLWAFKNLYNSSAVPPIFAQILLGATIALFLNFFANLFDKVSAHTAGVGGMLGAMFALMAQEEPGSVGIPFAGGAVSLSYNVVFALVFILAGLVGTARLVLKAHTETQVYAGYALGLFGQLCAWIWFM